MQTLQSSPIQRDTGRRATPRQGASRPRSAATHPLRARGSRRTFSVTPGIPWRASSQSIVSLFKNKDKKQEVLGVKRESLAGPSCDRLASPPGLRHLRLSGAATPGARRTWSRLCAHRSRTRRAAARSGSRGPAGTCTEQRPAEPRGPSAHAEEGRRLRESRAGPPRTRPRSRARTCWKGGDNGESLEQPRPLREGGARAGARAGRPLF